VLKSLFTSLWQQYPISQATFAATYGVVERVFQPIWWCRRIFGERSMVCQLPGDGWQSCWG